jgi:pimeloyl-ACP methyl ester carboxylesterase
MIIMYVTGCRTDQPRLRVSRSGSARRPPGPEGYSRPGSRSIAPPPFQWLALERLSLLEYGTYLAASPLLRNLAKGDGHPVLFLPGFYGSDDSTEQLRTVLKSNGHAVHGWRLGQNTGPHAHVLDGSTRRLQELHARYGRKVSVVGWSLGGIFARELARANPGSVRQVITLAAPFRFRPGDRGHASALYDMIGPRDDPFPGRDVAEDERPPLPVPATSIYTRTDGIVRWHACIDAAGPERENIEVFGTHSGLGYNIAATIAVADRLAQPEASWAPFRAKPALRHLYPRPVSWVPDGRAGRWKLSSYVPRSA